MSGADAKEEFLCSVYLENLLEEVEYFYTFKDAHPQLHKRKGFIRKWRQWDAVKDAVDACIRECTDETIANLDQKLKDLRDE